MRVKRCVAAEATALADGEQRVDDHP